MKRTIVKRAIYFTICILAFPVIILFVSFPSCNDKRNSEEERTKWISFYNENKADYARFVNFLTKNEDRFEKTNGETILSSNGREHDVITDSLKLQLQEFDNLNQ